MDAAVATLQTAARELQAIKAGDKSAYVRIVAKLRKVADHLSAIERRADHERAEAFDYAAVLRTAVTKEAARSGQPPVLQLPEEAIVEGPASDLRNLAFGLVEYAFTVGCDAIALRIDDTDAAERPTCVTEFVLRAPALPDFLQQRLWKAVRNRRGEVCTIVEPDRCHVRFALPIERRAAILSN